jgi:hypothetical protein
MSDLIFPVIETSDNPPSASMCGGNFATALHVSFSANKFLHNRPQVLPGKNLA